MTTIHYIGRVHEDGTLSIPQDAQKKLQLQPGDEIQVSLDRNAAEPESLTPNRKARLAMEKVAGLQEGLRYTSGEDTDRILREGRAGRMYNDEPAE